MCYSLCERLKIRRKLVNLTDLYACKNGLLYNLQKANMIEVIPNSETFQFKKKRKSVQIKGGTMNEKTTQRKSTVCEYG